MGEIITGLIGKFRRRPEIVPISETERHRHDRRELSAWCVRSVTARGKDKTREMLMQAVSAVEAGIATQDR